MNKFGLSSTFIWNLYDIVLFCFPERNKIFKDFIFLFLDRGEGGENEREKNINVWLPLVSLQLGPGPQPRHVPGLRIEPATLWFTGWHSIH